MKNISVFSDVNDYLPIFNGVILTDLIIISLLLSGLLKSKVLKIWYNQYSLGAVIADVFIIVIGIIIARFIYPFLFDTFSLWKFILLTVFIQIIHDILFYTFVTMVPRGKSKILDVFKDYGIENGYKAIVFDSIMMILSILFATYFKNLSLNVNILLLIGLVYIIPYFIFSV
jgi:hypothetical protein